MFINIKFDKKNYVEGFCTVGGIDGSVKIRVPEELVVKTETGGETLNMSFYSNFFAYKMENDTIVYDELEYAEYLKQQKEKKENEIKEKIRDLYQQREFYEFKKWSTATLDKEIAELETELEPVVEEVKEPTNEEVEHSETV